MSLSILFIPVLFVAGWKQHYKCEREDKTRDLVLRVLSFKDFEDDSYVEYPIDIQIPDTGLEYSSR